MINTLNNNGMTPRKQWCYDAAKEYVAKQWNCRLYKITRVVFYDDFGSYEDDVRRLSSDELTLYKSFQNKCWEEFKTECPEEFDENGKYSEKAWKEYLEICYEEMDFEDYVYYEGCEKCGSHIYHEYSVELESRIRFVDLTHPIRRCKLHFVDLDDNEVDEKKFSCSICITEDEYVQLLADYLHDSRVMITHLRDNYPGIYEKLNKHGYKDNHTWYVIFDEIKKDADVILRDRGEELSKL